MYIKVKKKKGLNIYSKVFKNIEICDNRGDTVDKIVVTQSAPQLNA